MGTYKLVIAEKPSVAQSIAQVIGATKKQTGYLEGNGYLVSWCFGHLVELAPPQDYDARYEKWRKEDLPILPDPFRYQVSDSTKLQFGILKGLMNRKDVVSLIAATDAGREGELIFRLVYHKAGCKKPFERLWISSMEDKAIADGFANLKPSAEYDALYAAALCRERADWIVGINATRLFSTLYGQTLNIGRVMTPTLAMLVQRDTEIAQFKPQTFYNVQITAAGVQATGERILDKNAATECEMATKKCGIATVTKMEQTPKTEQPPLLYDLTSLQRDANKCYGFTAQQTLDFTQSLYEKKLVTYPRTDSRYLTDDMEQSTEFLVGQMQKKYGWTKMLPANVKRVLNSAKVSDHHAIIPTLNVKDAVFSDIPSGEQKILGMITARLLAAIGDPCEKTEFRLELDCAGKPYKATATVTTNKGWREIQDWIIGSSFTDGEKADADADDDTNEIEKISKSENAGEKSGASASKISLADILAVDPTIFEVGKQLPVSDTLIKEGTTKPKSKYTESSLLGAMERAGADETPDEAERKGLGTPATRAGIIEKLVRVGLVERSGSKKTKYLTPTHKGIALITVMPEMIQSPGMTADWEQKLLAVEKHQMDAAEFMKEITGMVEDLVGTYEVVIDAATKMRPKSESIGTCPVCGGDVIDKTKAYFCSNRDCRFALWKDNRYLDAIGKRMTMQMAKDLLSTGRSNMKKCRSKKSGKTFDATLIMETNDRGQAEFHMEFLRKGK